jgi:hypothetical protein
MVKHAPTKRRWIAAGLVVLTTSTLALAGALVPAPLRGAIVIRSAGYERTFSERSGTAVIAVVSGRSGTSADDGRTMIGVFGKLVDDSPVAGRKARVVHVLHENAGKTAEELRSQRAEIVYFANGLENLVKEIPGEAAGVRRILVCADGEDVSVGCTIGVELASDKPRLVLNLKQANAAGLRFQPEFLSLARIVR